MNRTMLHRFVLHNGEICGASDRILGAGQVGLLMGWGVFSTLRVTRGVLFAFERHWARMKRDAELLRVPFPENPEWLKERLLRLVAANDCPEATMRVCVVKNSGTVFAGPDTGREFDLVALTTGLTDWGDSVRLSVAENARFAASPYSRTKVLSWAFNLNWYTEAHERGFDEVLLLNEHGQIAECTSANIFAVYGNQVYTPPLQAGCLPGITRELLLEQVRVDGVTVSERTLGLEDLPKADGLFITSTTRDLLPVAEVQGVVLESVREQGREVCMRLNRAFRLYLEDYACREVPA